MIETVEQPLFNDLHVHFRDEKMRDLVVPHTARVCDYALAMPNLRPPIVTGQEAVDYGKRIEDSASRAGLELNVLTTLYICGLTTPKIIEDAARLGVVAGKVYPKGNTTNSDDGIYDFNDPNLQKVFKAMQDCDMILSLHGELAAPAEVMDSESRFVEEVLPEIAENFPTLRIVLEHMTTQDAVLMVKKLARQRGNIAGTITAHHLEVTHSDVLRGKLKVHRHCMPFPKWEKDRQALCDAVKSGLPCFFLGSDSAPHAKHTKECAEACAGCYSAPVLAQFLAGKFEQMFPDDWSFHLSNFATHFGAEFYRLPTTTKTFKLKKEAWKVPVEIDDIVPFKYGEELAYSLAE